VEGDHDYGIHVYVDDDDHLDEDLGVPKMIGDLYAQVEADGEQPRFARVLEDAKKALSPGSRHSKFSFMVRMLYIKSRYRISNARFSTMMNLISSGYPKSELPILMMRQRNTFESWSLDTKTYMCARTIVFYFGIRKHPSMQSLMCAQYARSADGKSKLGPRRFHIRF
jgi:hypothetical protein